MKVIVDFKGIVVFDVDSINAVENIMMVEQNGYGSDATYLPKEDKPAFTLIEDKQLILSEQDTVAELRKKLAKTEELKSAEWWNAYNANNELKKLKVEVEALRSVCPHPKAEVPNE
jgi:hypothetical protein